MKLGSIDASPFSDLESKVAAASTEVLHSDEEIEKARANLFDDDESNIFWENVRKEQERRQIFARARSARIERELEARFGMLKGVALHPWTIKVMDWWSEQERIKLVGKPPVPMHASVVILFMAYRGKLPPLQLSLLACFLLSIHPILIVAGFLLAACLGFVNPIFGSSRRQKRKPKRKLKKVVLPETPLNTEKLELPLSLSLLSEQENNNEEAYFDFGLTTSGPLLSRLYCGALLARAGFTVSVAIDEHDEKQVEHKPKHSPCTFPVPFFVGQLYAKYADLIGTALIDDLPFNAVPAVTCIDTHKNPFVLMPGPEAFLESVSLYTHLEKNYLLYLLQHAASVAEDVLAYLAKRLPLSSLAGLRKNQTDPHQPITGAFGTAATYTTREAVNKILKQAVAAAEDQDDAINIKNRDQLAQRLDTVARLCGTIDENPRSFALWCFSIAHGINGLHRPPTAAALANAFARTIVAHGGILHTKKLNPRATTPLSLEAAKPMNESPQRILIAFRKDSSNHCLGLPLNMPIIIENFSLVFSDAGKHIACVLTSPAARNTDTLLAKLVDYFPATKDHCDFISPAGPITAPAVLPGAAGIIATGWLAAHKALGYKDLDLLYFNRTLINDYLRLPRHAPLIPVPSSS